MQEKTVSPSGSTTQVVLSDDYALGISDPNTDVFKVYRYDGVSDWAEEFSLNADGQYARQAQRIATDDDYMAVSPVSTADEVITLYEYDGVSTWSSVKNLDILSGSFGQNMFIFGDWLFTSYYDSSPATTYGLRIYRISEIP